MRFRAIADALGIILMFFTAAFTVPFAAIIYYWGLDHDPATQLASCEEGWRTIISFLIPALLCLVVGAVLRFIGRGYSEDVRSREAFVVVSVGWLVIALIGCLPYLISGSITNIFGAYFESMSGFTTTGATVMEMPGRAPEGADYLDVYPHSIMLWRSFTCWLGGIGIVVLSVVILSKFIGGGSSLVSAESSGPFKTSLKPAVLRTIRQFFVVYMMFTVLGIAVLRMAGMDGYDAVNHTFTCLATAGFSTHYDSIAYFDSVAIEAVIMVFMLVAGINFTLHYRFIAGIGDKKTLLRDPELRFYILIVTFAVILVTAILVGVNNISTWEAFRASAFNCVSIIATCGFVSSDFGMWPQSAQFILIMLMVIGPCAGSTGGGIKTIRLLVLLKTIRRQVRTAVRSRTVMAINIGENSLSENIVQAVVMYVVIYIAILITAALLFLLMGYDMVTSISVPATTLGGVGPALGTFGPIYTFESMPFYGKVLCVVCMWLGRLEIFAGLMLLFPSSYKE